MGFAVGRGGRGPHRGDEGASDLLGAVPEAFVLHREVRVGYVLRGKGIGASEEVAWEDVVENPSIFLQNIGRRAVVNFPSVARFAHRMSPKVENIVGHDLPKNARVLILNRKRGILDRACPKQVVDKEARVVGDVVLKGPTRDVGGGLGIFYNFVFFGEVPVDHNVREPLLAEGSLLFLQVKFLLKHLSFAVGGYTD